MKEIIVYCYNRCSTCKKAIGYLKENIKKYNKKNNNNDIIEIVLKDIITEKPNLEEMSKIIETKYDKKILVSDGKMIKRPLVIIKEGINKDKILLGFKEEGIQTDVEILNLWDDKEALVKHGLNYSERDDD